MLRRINLKVSSNRKEGNEFHHEVTENTEESQRFLNRKSSVETLCALCLGACYGPWLSTNTPIFGGTKHWLTAYPFLVLFAARGLSWAIDQAKLRADGRLPIWMRGRVVPLCLGAASVAGPMVAAQFSRPAYYSPHQPFSH